MKTKDIKTERRLTTPKLKIGVIAICFFMGLTSTAVSQVITDAHGDLSQSNNELRQFSPKSGKLVLKAQNYMAEDDYGKAIPILETSISMQIMNSYEKSVVYQLLGSSYYEIADYDKAAHAFEKAIQSGGLNKKEASAVRINIAQLLIAGDNFEQGALMIEDWHRQGGKLLPLHIEMLWQAWSQAQQYDKALPWAEKWFATAKRKERKHYDLLNFLYATLNMPVERAAIIGQMAQKWPNDENVQKALEELTIKQ